MENIKYVIKYIWKKGPPEYYCAGLDRMGKLWSTPSDIVATTFATREEAQQFLDNLDDPLEKFVNLKAVVVKHEPMIDEITDMKLL